jgi:dihydrofolate reductase
MVEGSSRPRFSVYIALSVDGYIARADGSLDWLSIVERPGEDYGYSSFFETVDVLVVGRSTYETALGFPAWPYAGKRCIVLTHRPASPHHGEEFFAGDPAALAEKLGREGARRVYVDGGQVIRQFLAARLVDDLTLSIIPIVLGAGSRLFTGVEPEQRLVLEDVQSFPAGLVQLRYRVG